MSLLFRGLRPGPPMSILLTLGARLQPGTVSGLVKKIIESPYPGTVFVNKVTAQWRTYV